MSRVPYEVHRARKRTIGLSRPGSDTPTETEFDFDGTSSLASYSTHITSSSYRPSSSSSRTFLPEDGDQLRRRTLSPSLSQASRSPSYNHSGQFSHRSLIPPRQSFPHAPERRTNQEDPGSSSWSLAPENALRGGRPDEADEERIARREKRRADRHASAVDGSQSTPRISSKARVRMAKEQEEERKFGSMLRTFVKWSVSGGREGSRWKGLEWGLGALLATRLAVLMIIGEERKMFGQTPELGIDLAESLLRRLISRSLGPTILGVAGSRLSLNRYVSLDHGVALLLEIAILWTGVIMWARMDGKRQARSWRTQLTGIITILLQPILISAAVTDPYMLPSLGIAVWTLVFFTRSQDIRGCVAMSLLLGLFPTTGRGFHLCAGLVSFLLAKATWLGGIDGLKHSAVLSATLSITLSAVWATSHFAIEPTGLLTLRSIEMAFREIGRTFSSGAQHMLNACQMNPLRTLAIISTQIPTISILLYAALSTRVQCAKRSTSIALLRTEDLPDNSVHTAPITSLLPLALAASSIPLHLLATSDVRSPAHPDLILSLMPLILMMAIRGDDDTWDVGVIVSNVATFRMRSGCDSDVTSASTTAALIGTTYYNRLIGHSPRRMTEKYWLRRFSYICYCFLFAIVNIENLQHTTLPKALRLPSIPPSIVTQLSQVGPVFSAGMLWIVWGWTLKKLAESAWAIGGFSGLDAAARRKEPTVVVQVIGDI